jgi:hypothetical protein
MDQDDPERRIAELERQLAERKRGADLPPANPRHTAAARRFVASPPFWGSKWSGKRSYIYLYGVVAAMVVLPNLVWAMVGPSTGAVFGIYVLFGLVPFVGTAYYRWYQRRKVLICVTDKSLTVNKRPGDVFSFSDTKLGQWGVSGGVMGTALHLQCGPHRFVLGGRDHRIAPRTRLEAPPADSVDAWLWASDFDELLTTVGRGSGSDVHGPAPGEVDVHGPAPGEVDVRGPAPGEPIRCLLIPLRFGLMGRRVPPSLAIDVGKDGIWVIDPNSNALIASASLAQLTATPANYTYRGSLDSGQDWTTPVLVVRGVPGLQPLVIRVPTMSSDSFWDPRPKPRFSWRGKQGRWTENPGYSVGEAEWLTLVEKFGLAPYVERHGEQR